MKNAFSRLMLPLLVMMAAAVATLDSRAAVTADSLDPQSVIGIEAIVAAASDGAVYSRFGHAMLRFVKADGDFSTDIVVSLEADVGDGKIDAIKGLDGGYQTVPTIDSFGDFWVKYVMTQERPLQRFIIPTSPAMRANLISTLKAWIANPSLAGRYTFLQNNCVGALAKLLEQSGFPRTIGMNPIIPTHLDHWLQHSFLSFYPALEMQSPKSLYQQAAKILELPLPDFMIARHWPSDVAARLEAALDDLDIKRLLLEFKNMPFEVRNALVQKHKFNNGGANLDQAMSYQRADERLYSVCTDLNCMKEVIESSKLLWPVAAIKRSVNSANFVYSLVVDSDETEETYKEGLSEFPRNLAKSPEMILNTQLFIEAGSGIN